MKFNHLMIDLETMGHVSTSAIVSIGAVPFSIETGEIGDTYYSTVDLQSCLDLGLTVTAPTIYWWLKQSDAARQELLKESDDLDMVLIELAHNFIPSHLTGDFTIWCKGASFDFPILKNAYDVCKYKTPWDFRGERDVRTLLRWYPNVAKEIPFEGVAHNPVDDCKHQIKQCVAVNNRI